jgi:hypothetical protein
MYIRFFSAVAVATLFATPQHLDVTADPTPATTPVAARVAAAPLHSLQPESRLWLEGGSTVRSYKCAATELVGEVRTTPDQPLPPLGELRAVVREAGITVPVAKLDCDNGTMNGHMRNALNAKEHETIAYRLDTFEVTAGGEAEGQVEMKGWLTIAGQERPVAFPAEIALNPDGTLRLQGQVELDMTEFGVKPPRLMLGTLKVHDNVTVHFDVAFKP